VVYSIDTSAKTPLVWACTRGFSVIAEMLISMGALVNKKDILGHTAIYYAFNYKHVDCVKVLLLNDAIVSKEDTELALKDKKVKNIMELAQSIMPIIKRMPYEKRTAIFE
jgi:ankyrin repeat protein